MTEANTFCGEEIGILQEVMSIYLHRNKIITHTNFCGVEIVTRK